MFDQSKKPAAAGKHMFASKIIWLKLQPKLAPPPQNPGYVPVYAS